MQEVSVCTHVCVCVYTRMCVCEHMYVSVCTHVCVCVYTRMCVCEHMYVSVCTHICVCVYTCMCLCVHTYVCARECMCVKKIILETWPMTHRECLTLLAFENVSHSRNESMQPNTQCTSVNASTYESSMSSFKRLGCHATNVTSEPMLSN